MLYKNEFVTPRSLAMKRKTFESGKKYLTNSNVEKYTKKFLEGIIKKSQSEPTDMDKFWAREYASYIVHCRQLGLKYSQYLPGRSYTYQLVARLINRFLKKEANEIRTLEAGCGSGITSSYLSLNGYSAFCVDHSLGALEFAKSCSYLEFKKKIIPIKANIAFLPFGEDTFDISFSLGVLEHYPNKIQNIIVREMARVTRDVVIIIVPNIKSPIFRIMEEEEYSIPDKKLIYPDEGDQFEVNFVSISNDEKLEILDLGSLHIVPTYNMKNGQISEDERKFFEKICKNALKIYDGNIIKSWRMIEDECSDKELKRYGWFSYAVFGKG